MKIVAIANQKGGVGKTTTAVTLAAGAARVGIRTLIIDLDTQGNVADSLGMEEGGDLADWLLGTKPMAEAMAEARYGLWVIRSDKTTAGLKVALAGMDFREGVLKRALRPHPQSLPKTKAVLESTLRPHPQSLPKTKTVLEREDGFDLVIIDCAPSVDVLHTAALVAADGLIIPTRLDQFAIKGVLEMLMSLHSVQQATDSDCKLIGILPTFYDRVTNESHDQLKNLASAFKGLVWPPIRQDVNCRIANRMGKTLWEMEKSKAQGDYRLALDKLI